MICPTDVSNLGTLNPFTITSLATATCFLANANSYTYADTYTHTHISNKIVFGIVGEADNDDVFLRREFS